MERRSELGCKHQKTGRAFTLPLIGKGGRIGPRAIRTSRLFENLKLEILLIIYDVCCAILYIAITQTELVMKNLLKVVLLIIPFLFSGINVAVACSDPPCRNDDRSGNDFK